MAEENEEQKTQETTAEQTVDEKDTKSKKKKSKKVVIIGGIILIDILVMAGIAWVIVQKIKGEDPTVKAMQEEQQEEKKRLEMVTRMGNVLESPINLTVNVQADDNEPHYLKCSIQLEWDGMENPMLGAELSKRLPKIQDIAINILSRYDMNKLLSPDGKESIREKLEADINAILPEDTGKIRNAYFTEFLVQ